jgi:MinD-like ATPase involved in chromosome partitioning or flagellar assembly
MSSETIPAWPRAEATIHPDGTGQVTIGGTSHQVSAATLADARTAVIDLVAQTAAKLGRPLRTTTRDPDGHWPLIIYPDQRVEPDDDPPTPSSGQPTAAREPDPPAPVLTLPQPVDTSQPPTPTGWVRPPRGPAHAAPARGRPSFLTQEPVEEPASRGWRGLLSRAGIRVSPSDAERAERADVHAVSQHWPGPRTIVVANGKGGAGKTPSTILLAAVFARYGGAGVLAWDANQTRGTLGWRTEQGPHDATVLDLLPQVPRLLGTEAQSGDLAHYTHHQTADRYDVLRSQPLKLASEQRLQMGDIDAIWAVAARFYRVIIIDTGNDESDETWLRAAWHADVLVVPTTTRPDHAEAGALLLDALRTRDERSARLAQQAVAIVTQADPRANKSDVDTIVDGYRTLTRQVVHIPYDPALVDGPLHWDSLHPATQRAWLRAAAAVADGL